MRALFDERSAIDDSEFLMDEVAAALLVRSLATTRTLPRPQRWCRHTSANGTPPLCIRQA